MTDDERAVRDALRRLPPVAPDPAFRARLRRQFVGERRAGGLLRPYRWWLLAAAAATFVFSARAVLVPTPWTLIGTSDAGFVEVDGQRLPIGDPTRLLGALAPGARIVTDAQAELRLQGGDALVLVVTPGTIVTLPAVPGRWLGRGILARLEAGELRGVTGAAFAGAQLDVTLALATAQVTGTTFAVIQNDEGSCVCVLEGRVGMRDERSDAPASVAPGHRRAIGPGAAPARDEALRPMERAKLEMLHDQVAARLGTALR